MTLWLSISDLTFGFTNHSVFIHWSCLEGNIIVCVALFWKDWFEETGWVGVKPNEESGNSIMATYGKFKCGLAPAEISFLPTF